MHGKYVTIVINIVPFYTVPKLGLGHLNMKNNVICGVCFMERATMQLRLTENINKIILLFFKGNHKSYKNTFANKSRQYFSLKLFFPILKAVF